MPGQLTIAPFPSDSKSNPYLSQLYTHVQQNGVFVRKNGRFSTKWLLSNAGKVNVLHFHWLDNQYEHWRKEMIFGRFVVFVLKLILARLLGLRITWTMHNASAHESKFPCVDSIARRIMPLFATVIVHGHYAKTYLNPLFGKTNIYVIPHGNYIGCYPNSISKESARAQLGTDAKAKIYLAFGMIRPYKGIPHLLETFVKFSQNGETLLIAGKPFANTEGLVRQIESFAESNENIKLHLRFIPDDEVQLFFNAADYVILPFTKILTSGSLVLALSFGKPVIAPQIGNLTELIKNEAGTMYNPDKPNALLEALEQSRYSDVENASKHALAIAESLDWNTIAQQHIRVYSGQ